jgi:hypothetical protein
MSWLSAFAVTQLIEVPIYLLCMQRQAFDARWPTRLLIAFGASAFTHPIVWFVLPRLGLSYWSYVALAETFAVLAEAFYLGRFGIRRPALWALLANATSAGLGLTSRYLFGWP